jgi:pyruvate dehydrogenase E2 component (dihydrolipoamide acetyltransferase)|tara:strand:- start:568 stop:1230 length:663 start_codon:yes stop_codon:yes gene_type:complete
MRAIIADRMHSSLQEMAQLTLTMDVNMDRVVELREQLKDIGSEELGAVPGYTDFVIAAAAQALIQHPAANSQIDGNDIVELNQINVGMAVAVPDGLVVPVVHGTDQLELAEIAMETSRLAEAARNKKLSLAEMEGGTFSVTALGMYGVDAFTPVINPPNSGILGVGRIRDDVDWDGDTPVKVKRMTISLTWDHRVLDGAPAAEFAATIKSFLEQPLRLLA